MKVNLQRIKETLHALNEFGYSDKGMNRIAYSDEEQAALRYLIKLMEEEGLDVHIDPIGNVIARREGKQAHLPAVACGSHIDTVYDGGQYDGTVGVIAGLEVIRLLNEKNITTEHPIELIIFACEESARFGVATVGSKAMTGLVTKEELARLSDRNGMSFFEALEAQGLGFNDVMEVVRDEKELKAFYELHVEQGIVLEHEQKQIGVVSGIAAPTRFEIKVIGQAAHSGATPMWLRKDAFAGATELVLAVEESARLEALNGTVATVGSAHVFPNAMNVVPGEVVLQVDIRGIFKASKDKVVRELKKSIKTVENKRDLQIESTELSDELPVQLKKNIVQSIKLTCENLQLDYIEMPSGAGHDAMNMAQLFPTGMIFVPSQGGVSHNKDEYTSIEDIAIGVKVLKHELLQQAQVVEIEQLENEISN